MSLFWSKYGDGWNPQGGQRKEWKDLASGDLIELRRKIWRVCEIRPVPVIDWDENDREYYDTRVGRRRNPQTISLKANRPASEEDWPLRPLYLILVPADGGKQRHVKIRPWGGLSRGVWVLSPHYPVCKDCGEPWPCRELDIAREVDKQAKEMTRLESILPGCCWSCSEPVTHRQSSIRFDGENLLLPGARSPVFHLRRKGPCASAAFSYEKRWVAAEEGRRWRLQCPGSLIRHADGDECTEDPYCPGGNVRHNAFMTHRYDRLPDGTVQSVYGPDFRCLRCEDALERGGAVFGEPPPGALL